jgi:hypothetical protein
LNNNALLPPPDEDSVDDEHSERTQEDDPSDLRAKETGEHLTQPAEQNRGFTRSSLGNKKLENTTASIFSMTNQTPPETQQNPLLASNFPKEPQKTNHPFYSKQS